MAKIHGFYDKRYAETLKAFAIERMAGSARSTTIEHAELLQNSLRCFVFKPHAIIPAATFNPVDNKYSMSSGVGYVWLREKANGEGTSQDPENPITANDLIQLKDLNDQPIERRAYNVFPEPIGNWPVPAIQDCHGDLYALPTEAPGSESDSGSDSGSAECLRILVDVEVIVNGCEITVRKAFRNICNLPAGVEIGPVEWVD